MDKFLEQKEDLINLYSKTEIEEIISKISVKQSIYNGVVVYTYKLKDKLDDDKEYEKSKILIDILPRACSIIFINGKFQTILEGNKKFSGKTPIDEDPEDDYSKLRDTEIYDHSEIIKWAKDSVLEIIYTEKENGKNCVCTQFISDDGEKFIVAGSKNVHIPINIKTLLDKEKFSEFKTKYKLGELSLGIFEDIIKNISTHLNCFSNNEFAIKRFSIVGEYCDGQHFCDGDNKIKWFSISKRGVCENPINSLKSLQKEGYNIVNYKTVFDSLQEGNNVEYLEKVFDIGRTDNGEGGVLYCRNKITNRVILVKNKAIGYIFKRIARQCILRGYRYIEDISRRVCETKDYHRLSTISAAKFTKLLFDFGFWMMNKCYPCKIIGHTSIQSVKGQLDNGFNIRWKEFLKETNNDEIKLSFDDIGEFNEKEYYKILGNIYHIRDKLNSPIVCMIQGLQGSGKSTLGNAICENLKLEKNVKYYEQDEYWGCTLSCQGALYHDIRNSNGSEVIILTRCNTNAKQYEKYLDLFQMFNCKIFFATPLNYFEPLYLAVSIAGIINRSNKGDRLIVGRFESDINEAMVYVNENFKNFISPENSINYPVFYTKKDLRLYNYSITAYNESLDVFKLFILNNVDKLNNLRVSIENEIFNIINEIKNINYYGISNNMAVYNKVPEYIGFFLNQYDITSLMKFVYKNLGEQQNFKTYCSHVTQYYFGKNKKSVIPDSRCNEFTKVILNISDFIIRMNDRACCFKIDSILELSTNNKIETKDTVHLSAYLPENVKPNEVNSFVNSETGVIQIPYKGSIEGTCLWIK